jgi:hypothetical protein
MTFLSGQAQSQQAGAAQGKVSIMAHSLGSVLAYDILCNQPDLYSALDVRPLSSSGSDRRSSALVRLNLTSGFQNSDLWNSGFRFQRLIWIQKSLNSLSCIRSSTRLDVLQTQPGLLRAMRNTAAANG